MKKTKKESLYKTYFKLFIAIAVFLLTFFALQRLLVPKYATYALEGNLVREYYNSTMDQDVLFLGDCEVYANFSTITLWEEFGITSYIRGSPQQLIWHSYYLLEDTLRHATQKPKAAVLSVMPMQYGEPQHEPYNRLTLDGMRLSGTKLSAITSSRMDNEDYLSYLFPLFRYKDNWRDVSAEDFCYFFSNPLVSINGFMIRSDTMPVGFLPDPIRRADYQFEPKPIEYLDRIVKLTAENDIELILIKAPVLYPHWSSEWENQIIAYAEKNDLIYINFLGYTDEIGLDFSEHTFNAGLHLNVYGAQLLSRYFGEFLTSKYNLPDQRNNTEAYEVWNVMKEQYYALIAIQLAEIAEEGKINTFLIN